MLTPTTSTKNNILVITRLSYFDVDRIISTIVLGKILASRYDSTVEILFDKSITDAALQGLVSSKGVQIVENLSPKFYSMTLEKGDATITDVKWEMVGNKLELKIYSEEGVLSLGQPEKSSGRPDYDYLYLLGIPTRTEAEKVLGANSDILDSAKVTNIDLRSGNNEFADRNHVVPEARTFAEVVMTYAEKIEADLNKEIATELLTGVYWKTNALRNKYAGEQSLLAAQKLIHAGADLQTAVSRVFASMSLVEVRAIQEIYHNLQVTKDKIAITKVSTETARQLTKVLPIYPNKNPLFTLKDIRAAFVLIPIEENKTLVLSTNHDHDLNLRKELQPASFVGDDLQGELIFEQNIEDTEKAINDGLATKIEPQKVQTPPVEKANQSRPAAAGKINQPKTDSVDYVEADPLPAAEGTVEIEEVREEPAPINNDPFAGFMPQMSDPLPPASDN